MGEIVELTPDIYNRIAAGEVIENPASVVKELVENSIDAGADIVKVIVEKAGKKRIVVEDNGKGMSEEDAILSIKKHTTSKIKSVEDLQNIKTFGFRGEALSSIVSVAIVDIITRRKEDEVGVKLHIENNDIQISHIGINPGTRIAVNNLFYNTPARLKFLKSDSSELLKIKDILTNFAMANYNVRFEIYIDNKTPLIFKKENTLLDRLKMIWGKDVTDNLLYFEISKPLFKIYGYASKPSLNKPNRSSQYLFLNKRIIKNKYFNYWISKAYENLIIKGRYPIVFVFIDASPEFVDVNVHPAKTEVRFLNEYIISSSLIYAIRKSLENENIIPEIKREISTKNEDKSGIKKEIENSIMNFFKRNKDNESISEKDSFIKKEVEVKEKEVDKERYEEKNSFYTGNYFSLFNTYIFFEKNNEEVLIIDQHAAHERIIYERLKRDIEKKENIKQNLLIPINVNLSPVEGEIVKNNISLFNEIGFEVEEFGNNSYLIRSIPAYIRHNQDDKSLFKDIIEILKENRKVDKKVIFDEILKTMSCKSAIKAGDYLSKEEKEFLITELLKNEEVYTCPHGRPAIIRLKKYEIEKWFKRKI